MPEGKNSAKRHKIANCNTIYRGRTGHLMPVNQEKPAEKYENEKVWINCFIEHVQVLIKRLGQHDFRVVFSTLALHNKLCVLENKLN